MPTNVLIAGGGPAAIEAALRLHRLAGERVSTTVLSPNLELEYRPRSVLAPFAAGGATGYPIARIAADAEFVHRIGALANVDAAGHAIETGAGERIAYDVLLLASGAIAERAPRGATTFTGTAADAELLHGLVQDVEGGYTTRVAFVVPPGAAWSLPLYELALMLAERAFEMGIATQLHIVTPEDAPLAVFGRDVSREVASLLETAGIALHTGVHLDEGRLVPGGEPLDVQRVVTLPRLRGPAIAGLPSDSSGFLVTDAHGRVTGVPDVYAAGDLTSFPVKQGGIACQQADAAADDIAARAGAPVRPEPFAPVLRAKLVTERWERFLRRDAAGRGDDAEVAERALWWPPTKIAGGELAGYLASLDEERVRPAVGQPVAGVAGLSLQA